MTNPEKITAYIGNSLASPDFGKARAKREPDYSGPRVEFLIDAIFSHINDVREEGNILVIQLDKLLMWDTGYTRFDESNIRERTAEVELITRGATLLAAAKFLGKGFFSEEQGAELIRLLGYSSVLTPDPWSNNPRNPHSLRVDVATALSRNSNELQRTVSGSRARRRTARVLAGVSFVLAACQASSSIFPVREDPPPPTAVMVTGTPISPVDQYIQAVNQDLQNQYNSAIQAGVGAPNFFGKGYSACVVTSDCLVGEETCQVGSTPNTFQAPGYCVPVFSSSPPQH